MNLRITEHCKRKSITLQELADKLGIARSTLANTLSKGNPTIETLSKIAKSLDVCVSDLLDEGKEQENNVTITCPVCKSKFKLEE